MGAAVHEVEHYGLTQFRVKRVATEAGISIGLLYSYFEDREDLIAATVVHRFREVTMDIARIYVAPLAGVSTPCELRAALETMIAEAQLPRRTEARTLRLESLSFSRHNDSAREGIAAAKAEAGQYIADRVQPLVDLDLLAPGVSGVAFARLWYALFFGQIALEDDTALAIDTTEWLTALKVVADAVVRSDDPVASGASAAASAPGTSTR